MGNYKFRLSDMMPNAWFYKLKDMGRSKKKHPSKTLKRNPPTASSTSQNTTTSKTIKADKFSDSPAHPKVLDTQFPEPPRKSSKRSRNKRKTIYKPSLKLVSPLCSNGFSSQEKLNSDWKRTSFPAYISPEYSSCPLESSLERHFRESLLSDSEEDDGFIIPAGSFDQKLASRCSSCKCKVSSSTEDTVVKVAEEVFHRKTTRKPDGFNRNPKLKLPPILTKPAKVNDKNPEAELLMSKRVSTKLEGSKAQRTTIEQKTTNTAPRKSFSNSSGIRLRSNSPRIASRKLQPCGARRSVSRARNGPVSESFVVVKSSVDPQRDFRDSMVEMIVENNIRASKDLEELLACYLSLNSNEYHDLIVKAFEQIWLGMTHLRL